MANAGVVLVGGLVWCFAKSLVDPTQLTLRRGRVGWAGGAETEHSNCRVIRNTFGGTGAHEAFFGVYPHFLFLHRVIERPRHVIRNIPKPDPPQPRFPTRHPCRRLFAFQMPRRHSDYKSSEWNRALSFGNNNNNHNSSRSINIGASSRSSSSSSLSSSEPQETKSDAAVTILASAMYLWDFFLSSDSHASLGLARDTGAYIALRELLTDRVPGGGSGGVGGDKEPGAKCSGPVKGKDAVVDYAVSVGKALLDMQRHVLSKVRSVFSAGWV